MAKIIIELDTETDTLESVIRSLQFNAPEWAPSAVDGDGALDMVDDDPTPEQIEAETRKVVEPSTTSRPEIDVRKLTAMDGARRRGDPAKGHRRRTNKQIAADDAYFAFIEQSKAKGHAALAELEKGVEKEPATVEEPRADFFTQTQIDDAEQTGEIVDNDPLGISSGEERVNPQDTIDEAAESAKIKAPEPTHDDLRKAVGEYQKKHGMPKAQKLIPELIGGPIQQVRPQDIPAMIFKVQAATEAPIEKVEPKFTPVTTAEPPAEEKKPEPKTVATRHQVNDAINDYARKYDGSLDPTAMIATRADVPQIVEQVFGKGVTFKQVDPTSVNHGKLLTAVRKAIDENPFKRSIK